MSKVLLKILEAELKKAQSPVLNCLNPKLKRGLAKKAIKALGYDPLPELIELYTWHNGINTIPSTCVETSFGLLGTFMSLQGVEKYLESGGVDAAWSQEFGEATFFPFANSADYFLCNSKNPAFDGRVFIVYPSILIIKPMSIYDSVDCMLHTMIQCFQKKAYWYDAEGYFEIDTDAEIEIAKNINPGSEFWIYLNS